VLTPDGTDVYTYTSTPDSMHVLAPVTNESSNLRTVVVPDQAPDVADEMSCATWVAATTWSVQQGAALQVRRDDAGNVHALTVTKNVFGGGTWIFNVHRWNSGASPAFELIATFDLSGVFRMPTGLPRTGSWRMCARVQHDTLDFEVWPAAAGRPRWGNPNYGGTVPLDPADGGRGQAGWYIGHVPRGGMAAFSRLGTWSLDSPIDGIASGAGNFGVSAFDVPDSP
jgi:hypothetical protein